MSAVDALIEEIVTANRILAREEVLDTFGHVSARHPERPDRYLLSRARAPDCVEPDDIMEFMLDGTPIDPRGRAPYVERFIHGAIYEARPDVGSVVHSHSGYVVPFGVTPMKLRPIAHVCSCIGADVPVWDSQDSFGDTTLLVVTMPMGRDLVRTLGDRPAALMRGHGCVVVGPHVRSAVFTAVQLHNNARLQMQALPMGPITFLTDGEIAKMQANMSPYTWERAWENWCKRAGRPYAPARG